MLITVGFTKPTPELMQEWMQWFEDIKENILEQVGLMNGKEITKEHVKSLPVDGRTLTGYLIIKAKDESEAEEIAKKCPMISGSLLYEIREQ